MREEIREEIKKEMKKEYFDMKAQLLADMRVELVSPSAQPCNPPQQPSLICVSTKGSCDVPLEEASLIVDADYELFIDDLLQSLVALGNLSNYIVLHVFYTMQPLHPRACPTQEVKTVGQALGNFILWLLRLAKVIANEVIVLTCFNYAFIYIGVY